MKATKHILSITLILIITLSSLHFIKNKSKTKIVNYMLSNIEALAQNENYHRVECFGIGTIDCPISNTKRDYIAYDYIAY